MFCLYKLGKEILLKSKTVFSNRNTRANIGGKMKRGKHEEKKNKGVQHQKPF